MDDKYAGMTINERLFVSGLMNTFDRAVEKKDIDSIIDILKQVELTDISIKPILKQLGLLEND